MNTKKTFKGFLVVVLKFILDIMENTFVTYTKYSRVDDEQQKKGLKQFLRSFKNKSL